MSAEDPIDRMRLDEIDKIAQVFLKDRAYEATICEDMEERTFVVTFANILSVDEPVDLFMLANVVERCKPMVKECTVTWDRTTASHMTIEIELWKSEVGIPSKYPSYEPFYPDMHIDIKKQLVESKFEMRNTPASWEEVLYPKIVNISQSMYTRGEDIPTPSIALNIGSQDSVIVDFANNDSITYSFLEHATERTGVSAIDAKGKEFTLSFCVDNTPGFSFPLRQ
jgi:hypothetical protein